MINKIETTDDRKLLQPSYPDTVTGKSEISSFYDSVKWNCGWVIDKELFENIARIETVYGTQDARSGVCKGIMQINPTMMSSDLRLRPWYYGIKLTNGFIDEWKSNSDAIALLRKAIGSSLEGKKISSVISYLKTNIKNPNVNMCFSALILRVFSVDKTVMRRKLPNLASYLPAVRQTLKNKKVLVDNSKLMQLVARIQQKEQPLEQQYRVLRRYNTGPAYGLNVLYCKEYVWS